LGNGNRRFSAGLGAQDPVGTRGLLSGRSEVGIRLLEAALDGSVTVPTRTFDILLQSLPGELLSEGDILGLLQRDSQPAVADHVIQRIAQLAVPRFVENQLTAVAQFFDLASWRRWVQRVGPQGIVSSIRAVNWRDALVAAWAAFAQCADHSDSRAENVVEIVAACFREASAPTLDRTAHASCQWFQKPKSSRVKERLAAEAVVAIRRVEPYSSTQWLEACFYIAYAPTYHGISDPFGQTPWPQPDWDHAQPLREWLVRHWADRRWPGDAFLRTLGRDHQLLNDCVEMIRYRYGRWEFTEALMNAARTNSSLSDWVPTLERWYNEYKPTLRRWFD